jgi:hypothetical protein
MALGFKKVFSAVLGTSMGHLLGMLGQKVNFLKILRRRARDKILFIVKSMENK